MTTPEVSISFSIFAKYLTSFGKPKASTAKATLYKFKSIKAPPEFSRLKTGSIIPSLNLSYLDEY